MFPCEYYENFKNTYFEKHLRTTATKLWTNALKCLLRLNQT